MIKPGPATKHGFIVKGVGGLYHVQTADGLYFCYARGLFRNKKGREKKTVTPLVGDHVTVLVGNEAEKTGTVATIEPRTNEMIRPAIANVDQVIVTVSAAQPAFNPGLLDRFLVLAAHAGIDAVICVSKADLLVASKDKIKVKGQTQTLGAAQTRKGEAFPLDPTHWASPALNHGPCKKTTGCNLQPVDQNKNPVGGNLPPTENLQQPYVELREAQRGVEGERFSLAGLGSAQGLDFDLDLDLGSDVSRDFNFSSFQHDERFKPYVMAGYKIIFVSTLPSETDLLAPLRAVMAGKLSVFAGPSGVGKSSLINALLPHAGLDVGEISVKLKRGKHTTRAAEILPLGDTVEAGYIADTPGFSSLDTDNIPALDLANCFIEFATFAGGCKFNDCLHGLHNREADCAVRAQVGKSIHPARYASYLGLAKRK